MGSWVGIARVAVKIWEGGRVAEGAGSVGVGVGIARVAVKIWESKGVVEGAGSRGS